MQNQISSLLLTLVGFCAIDWYRPDGSLVGRGAFVYLAVDATSVAESQLPLNPGYTFQIRCEEK